jgi:hypothetical protein
MFSCFTKNSHRNFEALVVVLIWISCTASSCWGEQGHSLLFATMMWCPTKVITLWVLHVLHICYVSKTLINKERFETSPLGNNWLFAVSKHTRLGLLLLSTTVDQKNSASSHGRHICSTVSWTGCRGFKNYLRGKPVQDTVEQVCLPCEEALFLWSTVVDTLVAYAGLEMDIPCLHLILSRSILLVWQFWK